MNRRRRRAAGPKTSSIPSLQTAADIPLARPATIKPQGKTLYQVVSERQAGIASHGRPFPKSDANRHDDQFVSLSPDGTVTQVSQQDAGDETLTDSEEASPIFDTLFLAVPLACLHFTLSVLTAHQYAQELRLLTILQNTIFVALPTLCLLIHLLHGHLVSFPPDAIPRHLHKAIVIAQQIVFLLAANVAGCYLIHLTNDRGYYAIMKRAPSIGTVWVWTVLELGLSGALAGVAGPGIYAWWNEYGIF